MGNTYLSRLWYGFILSESEFLVPDEVYEDLDIIEWLDNQGDLNCTIGMKYGEPSDEFFVYVIETLKTCDERDGWAAPIEIPIDEKIKKEFEWRAMLKEFCEKKGITFKAPSWHLTVENW